MEAAIKRNTVKIVETKIITQEQFLAEHNKLSPSNLRASGGLLLRFRQEKSSLFKEDGWSLEKLRRPFIIWLTAQSFYKKSKDEQLIFYSRPFGLSLCHGANGVPGVVAVLHGIAGFSQSVNVSNHYTIQPDLMDLKWANIEFPVKEGRIKLKLSAAAL